MIAPTQTSRPLVGSRFGLATQSPIALSCTHLKRSGLRITQPRIALLTSLIKRGRPTSIEQLHGELAPGSCDLVTVYRCLAAFEDIGLVRRSFCHNGTSLYTFNLGEAECYHFVCKGTQQVEEINAEATAEIRRCVQQVEETLKARGYTEVTHMVEFFGRTPPTPPTAHGAPEAPSPARLH